MAELLDREGPSKSCWRAVNATLGRRPAHRIPGIRDPKGALIDDDNTINNAHAAYADLASNEKRATTFDDTHRTDTDLTHRDIYAGETAAALTEPQLPPIATVEVHTALVRYLTRDTAAPLAEPDNLTPHLSRLSKSPRLGLAGRPVGQLQTPPPRQSRHALWRNLVALYSQVRACIRTNAPLNQRRTTGLSTGVRQGCVLSPLLHVWPLHR